MWYEILPGAIIICVAMSVPIYGMYGLNKLVLGNGNRRCMEQRFDRMLYRRDDRLTGNPYKVNSLDAVPDSDN